MSTRRTTHHDDGPKKVVDKPNLRPDGDSKDETPLERAVDGPDGDLAKKAIAEGRDPNRPENALDKDPFELTPVDPDVDVASLGRPSDNPDDAFRRQTTVETTTQTTGSESVTKTAEQIGAEPGGADVPDQAVAKVEDAPREPNQEAPAPRHHQPGRENTGDFSTRPTD
jgi:hypothetical protein